MHRTVVLLMLLFVLLTGTISAQTPIIFDTDLGNDVDDVLALAMLHSLASRHEVRLLAVTTTKDHPLVAPAIEAINAFYGRPEIPVGVVRDGKTTDAGTILPALAANAPRRDRPEAVALLRTILGAQPDRSVTIVQVGFSTNLARLIENDGALIAQKVRLLVMMGGDFAGGQPEFNVKMDIPAAQMVFRDWPTPIVVSGYEVGAQICYRAWNIQHAFTYEPRHPVAAAYRAYKKMPYDRPCWDLTAVLHAVRPDAGYFSLSTPGVIQVDMAGATTFLPDAAGHHRYLTATPAQRSRALEAFEQLASEPPH